MINMLSSDRSRWTLLLLALAVAVSLVVVFGLRVKAAHELDDRRSAAVTTAKSQALVLLGINKHNVARSVELLVKGSTGDFRRQLGGLRATFEAVVKQGQISTDGEVLEAAASRVTSRDASVLLAMRARVTNSDTSQPRDQPYRLIVDLQWNKDRWLVSSMEFAR